MLLLKTAADYGATVCSNLLVLSVCPWDRLPFCLYPPVKHTGNTLEDNKVESVKMERVRDTVGRGRRRRKGTREGTKWQKEQKKQDKGVRRGWEGCKEGRSAAAILSEAIICRDMLWRLSLYTHTQTSVGGTVASPPTCKCSPNVVINCFQS